MSLMCLHKVSAFMLLFRFISCHSPIKVSISCSIMIIGINRSTAVSACRLFELVCWAPADNGKVCVRNEATPKSNWSADLRLESDVFVGPFRKASNGNPRRETILCDDNKALISPTPKQKITSAKRRLVWCLLAVNLMAAATIDGILFGLVCCSHQQWPIGLH